jgi:hypothetical protein
LEEVLWSFEAQFVSRNDPLEVHTIIARVPVFLVKREGRHLLKAAYKGVPMVQVPVRVQWIEVPGEAAR